MKIAFILGTRPEIIKLAPIINEIKKRKVDFFIIHTNQHYDSLMDSVFFNDLNLPKAKYNLKTQGSTHGDMLGDMLIKLDKILMKEKVDKVIVQGDTNSTLAGALSAAKLNINIVHIEAGCRSFDKTMPEEINRIIVDSVSDLLFASTKTDYRNLINTGINKQKIFLSGSTAYEATMLAESRIKTDNLHKLDLEKNNYILITIHRASNVDTKKSLIEIIELIKTAHSKLFTNQRFIWPLHPRTKSRIKKFNIILPNFIKIIEPLPYLPMIELIKNSYLVMTDSGGVQEEAYFLKRPCLTLRDSTEWSYTVSSKKNFIVSHDFNKLEKAVKYFQTNKLEWDLPYSSGISEKIVDNILKK